MKLFILAVSALIALSSAGTLNSRTYRAKAIRAKQGIDVETQLASRILQSAPRNARLIDFNSNGAMPTDVLLGSLTSNATLIRENIVGGFDCTDREYGYYADQNNDCQIFHICVPLAKIFKNSNLFTASDIMHFAFICPKYTIFTQDAMVCAWEREAVACEYADDLYHLNLNFFKTTVKPEVVDEEVPIKFTN